MKVTIRVSKSFYE